MRSCWALPLVVTACSFTPGVLPAQDDAGNVRNDADRLFLDARPDTPPDQMCFGSGLLVQCYMMGQLPTGDFNPPDRTFDTDNDDNCDREVAQLNGPELCIKTANTITIANDIRWSGSRPIVLLAVTTLIVSGQIDVSEGAGANTGNCAGQTDPGNDLSNGASGGAGGGGGGGFGTPGGAGAAGNGAPGGLPGVAVPVSYIRGGCAGRRGGRSDAGNGTAGSGGGGVYLVAGQSITIAGEINASGGGGGGAPNKGGGGGGGSGGLIGLDAPTVTIASGASLFANGGGGGEGGGGGNSGAPGEDPTAWDDSATGGNGNGNGGNGGAGAKGTAFGGDGGTVGNGGGGGGGGVGHILVFAQTKSIASTSISPPVP